MPFLGDTFTHLFSWDQDPQRQEKLVNARLEAEFDGVDTGLSAVAARTTIVEAAVASGVADDSITNAKLANMAQSTIKGRSVGAGTGDPTDLTATQATAVLNVFTDALKGLVPASSGGTANFLRADGAFAAPPSGAVLQVLQATYATNTNLTTTIPLDDTTPTNSEGTQVLSQAITPADNTNKVLCVVHVWGAVNTVNTALIVALFRGTTCIQVASHTFTTTNFPACVPFSFLDSPASASAQTYSVRVGGSTGTVRLNGSAAGRQYGGAASSTLTLTEIAA